jgi:hypothetical protein
LGKGANSTAPANGFGFLQFSGRNNKLIFVESNDAGGAYETNLWSPDLTDGWHHILARRSSGNTELFVNNAFITSKLNSPAPNLSNAYPIEIGRPHSGSPYLNFSISDVRVYNKALSLDEINTIYRDGR